MVATLREHIGGCRLFLRRDEAMDPQVGGGLQVNPGKFSSALLRIFPYFVGTGELWVHPSTEHVRESFFTALREAAIMAMNVASKLAEKAMGDVPTSTTQAPTSQQPSGEKMKALVWHGKKDVRIELVDKPQIIEPTDAVVKVTRYPL